VHFVGPVLIYDMMRMARRSRFMLLRTFYVVLLFSLLATVYESYFPITQSNWFEGQGDPNTLAQFASTFFMWFMIIQWLAVLLLTPAYVAGSIAEEKHRKTLEYILATDLTNREVVLGKLVSRLGNLTLFILAGLPILSLTQLFGGVSPDLLWSGFIVTLMTMLSLSGLSIWISVLAKRPRDAILLTYLIIITYFALYGALLALKFGVFNAPLAGGSPSSPAEVAQLGFDWLWYVYTSGNVFQALYDLYEAIGASAATGGYGQALLGLLLRYVAFHGTIFLACTTLAVLRLRRVFIKQAYSSSSSSPGGRGKSHSRSRHPNVGKYPMLWKEVVCEGSFGLGWVGTMLTALVALLVIGFGLGILIWTALQRLVDRETILIFFAGLAAALALIMGLLLVSLAFRGAIRIVLMLAALGIGAVAVFLALQLTPNSYLGASGVIQEVMNVYVRIAGTAVAALIWLAVTVRAAGSVGAERDRQTLESLLSSPLTNVEILVAKWIGSVTAVRWLFLLLLAIWTLGLISGGLSPIGLLLVAGTVAIYTAFCCSLGLFCSVHCSTSLRAMLWAVSAVIVWGGAHLFCTGSCMAMFLIRSSGPAGEWPLFFLLGQTPIFVAGAAALQGNEFSGFSGREMLEVAAFCFVGVCTSELAAVLLWALTVERFKYTCGRITKSAPDARVDSASLANKPKNIPVSGGAAGP